MAASTFLLLVLVGALGLVTCQRTRDSGRQRLDRGRERENVIRISEGCTGKVMDIFFILDSSSSIYINDYWSGHTFVRDVISRFDVSPESTRVGMLTYSDDLERPVMSLNRYTDKNELLNSISRENLPYRTGTTNTDMAIRYARQISEFRQDITKVLVVMTDGGSFSPSSTAREAELARNAGFYLFVVGMGQYTEVREWRAIASDPDSSFVYNITNPRFMEDVKFTLPPQACSLPPIISGGSCNVNQLSEVYFVASRSASNKAIDLIENFKRRTRDQRDSLRVNYMIEACGSVTDAALDDEGVVCDRFGPRSGDTKESVDALFVRARSVARESRNNGGRDANQIIVLFADDPTMSLSRFSWSDNARSAENFEDVSVIVVDLGMRVHGDFVQRMLSNRVSPNRNNVIRFLGGPLDNQANAQRQFLDTTCSAINNQQTDDGFVGPST